MVAGTGAATAYEQCAPLERRNAETSPTFATLSANRGPNRLRSLQRGNRGNDLFGGSNGTGVVGQVDVKRGVHHLGGGTGDVSRRGPPQSEPTNSA